MISSLNDIVCGVPIPIHTIYSHKTIDCAPLLVLQHHAHFGDYGRPFGAPYEAVLTALALEFPRNVLPTEMLINGGHDLSEAMKALVGSSVSTVASLLRLYPPEY
jgi:hypothetical protein